MGCIAEGKATTGVVKLETDGEVYGERGTAVKNQEN
jgi:hypothetical protein